MKDNDINNNDQMVWDEAFFANYVEYLITEFSKNFTFVKLVKGEKARCPACNSEVNDTLEVGNLNLCECDNCLFQFAVERLGSIYYIVANNK
jgi:hypothetical protein